MSRTSSIEAVTALHAEAVASQVVVTARRADQAARRIGLQPSLVLAPVPNAVLRSEHPSPAFVVEHSKVSDRDTKCTRWQISGAPLIDQELVSDLCFGEWIDRHPESMRPAKA